MRSLRSDDSRRRKKVPNLVALVCCCLLCGAIAGRKREPEHLPAKPEPNSVLPLSKNFSFSLFIAPKPGFKDGLPPALLLWQAELQPVLGQVILLINRDRDIALAEAYGFKTERIQESKNGFPRLDSLLDTISSYGASSQMVGFCNSDLLPGQDFGDTVRRMLQLDVSENQVMSVNSDLLRESRGSKTSGWLVVVSRVDYQQQPSDGHIFREGGVDMWIWNVVEDAHGILGFGSVPAFGLGRPWFDNWITATAIQLGKRHVIDGTLELRILHKIHKRLGKLEDWSDTKLLSEDHEWTNNKNLASGQICAEDEKCSEYRLGIGTTCEAPYFLTAKSIRGEKKLELRARSEFIPCPSCQRCYP
mmetsp:Transcript_9431/g.42934  ORF Transcript_9431/g.42934 Transcript_9431/m.42934 type:complete len:361 (-) Transcript_9431:1602-2684(-)